MTIDEDFEDWKKDLEYFEKHGTDEELKQFISMSLGIVPVSNKTWKKKMDKLHKELQELEPSVNYELTK